MFNSVYSFGENIKEALVFCKVNELYYFNKNNKNNKNKHTNDKLQLKTRIFIIEKPPSLKDKKFDSYLFSICNYNEIQAYRKLTSYEFKALNILQNFYGEDDLNNICEIFKKNEKHMCIGYKICESEDGLNYYKFIY